MNKLLYDFFEKDHRRLDVLLEKATEDPDHIKMEYYHPFRSGLLTHIKMEEKILFPAGQEANGGERLEEWDQLRLDHGALTSLMAVPPDTSMLRVLRYILEVHDEMEERPGGIYDVCDALTRHRTKEILAELKDVTETPVRPLKPSEYVLEATKRAVERAGYDYDELAGTDH